MDFETLGNIGDFLGGIGVIITLIYLTSQIRQNTKSIRVSAFQTAQRDVAQFMDQLASDPDLVRLFFEGGRSFPRLDQRDRQRYATLMVSLCKRIETIIHELNAGNIDPSQCEGILEHCRVTLEQPGAKLWWEEAKHLFNKELRDHVSAHKPLSDDA